MICKSCGSITTRLMVINGSERCHKCGGFSEGGGVRLDGVLSRQRVRDQAVKYEGDTLNPWRYDKTSKKFAPNDDFLKLHSSNAQNFFQAKDLARSHPKLARKISEGMTDKTPVEGIGNEAQAQLEVIKSL